jgi:Cu/Ag efflux pump CusA
MGLGRPGHEIEAPMAITILGGLTSATFLNLVLLPETLIRLQFWLGLAEKPRTAEARKGLEPIAS